MEFLGENTSEVHRCEKITNLWKFSIFSITFGGVLPHYKGDLNTTNNKTTKQPILAKNNQLNVKVSVEDKRGEGAPENVHSLKLLAL